MDIIPIQGKQITFTHNSNWWPERKIPEDEVRLNDFLRSTGLRYLTRICESVGITVDRDSAGSMGVSRPNIRFDAYNLFGQYYTLGVISRPQELLDFSFDILGDRIKLN